MRRSVAARARQDATHDAKRARSKADEAKRARLVEWQPAALEDDRHLSLLTAARRSLSEDRSCSRPAYMRRNGAARSRDASTRRRRAERAHDAAAAARRKAWTPSSLASTVEEEEHFLRPTSSSERGKVVPPPPPPPPSKWVPTSMEATVDGGVGFLAPTLASAAAILPSQHRRDRSRSEEWEPSSCAPTVEAFQGFLQATATSNSREDANRHRIEVRAAYGQTTMAVSGRADFSAHTDEKVEFVWAAEHTTSSGAPPTAAVIEPRQLFTQQAMTRPARGSSLPAASKHRSTWSSGRASSAGVAATGGAQTPSATNKRRRPAPRSPRRPSQSAPRARLTRTYTTISTTTTTVIATETTQFDNDSRRAP